MTVQPARPNAMAFGTRLPNDSLTGDRSDRLLLAVLLSSVRAPAGHGFPTMGCSQHCFPLRKSGRPDRVEYSFESSYPGLKKWSCWPRGSSRPPPRHSPSRPRENHPKTLGKAWVQWDGWRDLLVATSSSKVLPVPYPTTFLELCPPTTIPLRWVPPAGISSDEASWPRRVSSGTPAMLSSSPVCPATSSTPGSVNRPNAAPESRLGGNLRRRSSFGTPVPFRASLDVPGIPLWYVQRRLHRSGVIPSRTRFPVDALPGAWSGTPVRGPESHAKEAEKH